MLATVEAKASTMVEAAESAAWSWPALAQGIAEVTVAAAIIAGGGWLYAQWKWKPHLRIEQSVSWRWVNEDTFGIVVAVQYSNTSAYRSLEVQKMLVALRRLAPLSAEELNGPLPVLSSKPIHDREWHKGEAPKVEPGETLSDVFVFPLGVEEANRLEAFIVYTFIPEQKDEARGWGLKTCHDIGTQPRGGAHGQ